MSETNTETTVVPANGGSPTDSRTPKPKPPSAATRKANATQRKPAGKPAPKGKDATVTPLKAKPAKPESTEPGPNAVKQVAGNRLIDLAADDVKSFKPGHPLWGQISKPQFAELMGSYVSFTPGGYWRVELPEPNTGRGARHRLAK